MVKKESDKDNKDDSIGSKKSGDDKKNSNHSSKKSIENKGSLGTQKMNISDFMRKNSLKQIIEKEKNKNQLNNTKSSLEESLEKDLALKNNEILS